MPSSCEVCGAPVRGRPASVEIDGAVMQVCASCSSRGRRLAVPARTAPFRRSLQAPELESDYLLEADFGVRVRHAREGLGLSQEELGRRMNVKTSVVSHVESQKLKPDGILIKKLEHELKIDLIATDL